jgi:hypothetical protein
MAMDPAPAGGMDSPEIRTCLFTCAFEPAGGMDSPEIRACTLCWTYAFHPDPHTLRRSPLLCDSASWT